MIKADYKISDEKRIYLDKILGALNARSEPFYLFGWNIYSKLIFKRYKILGLLVDESSDQSAEVNLVSLESARSDVKVICCAGGRPATAMMKLKNAGLQAIHVFELMAVANGELGEIHFNEGFASHYTSNLHRYRSVFDDLEDHESKVVLEKLIAFRVSHDLDYLSGFKYRENEQYFESFLPPSAGSVFADVGAFDGYTTSEFLKFFPDCKASLVFEPNHDSYNYCLKRFSDDERVRVFNYGLSNFSGKLKFKKAGSASAIGVDGKDQIQVRAMDSLDIEGVGFLKIDVEGFEYDVLSGASETIRRYKPSIAVACYHGAGPIVELHEFIKGLHPSYKVFIRHYTESIYETVMFFIPE